MYVCHAMLSHFKHHCLCVTLWTVANQAPLSMGLSRQDTGVGCHALLQGIFLTQGLNPHLSSLLLWQASSITGSATWEAVYI